VDPITIPGWTGTSTPVLSFRCPRCRQIGTFESSTQPDLLGTSSTGSVQVGSRRCPNPACHAHVFAVSDASQKLVASYPPETIDFDSSNLPKPVLDSLTEAITCHAAEAHRAAALMVRRALEDLCDDRGATGPNLKTRLESLSDKIAVAKALVEGLDNLRLLGNDAAHVNLHDFDAIGPTESGLAIEILKELLKGVYQYEDLVAKLEALKRPAAP
jgi:hypothetical protein